MREKGKLTGELVSVSVPGGVDRGCRFRKSEFVPQRMSWIIEFRIPDVLAEALVYVSLELRREAGARDVHLQSVSTGVTVKVRVRVSCGGKRGTEQCVSGSAVPAELRS